MINIGFTGTSEGMTTEQAIHIIKYLDEALSDNPADYSAHHGDCVGADARFDEIAYDLGLSIYIYPPINPKKRAYCNLKHPYAYLAPEKEYLVRNKDIVNAAYIMIATPKEFEEQQRGGTWSTIRFAKKRNRLLRIIYPNGSGAVFLGEQQVARVVKQ